MGELLFSLQVYADRLSLSGRPNAALLVGFQLLQLEIVLLDREPRPPSLEVALERGQSCLFQAEPTLLLRQLREDGEAPLALLLMAQEGERARLLALASVSLPLHVGLEASQEVLELKVSEWASHSGQWDLLSHDGHSAGTVSGSVTLSCLGRTMAPHLKAALGVQIAPIGSPLLIDAIDQGSASNSHQEPLTDDGKERAGKCETADAQVQCEEDRQSEMATEGQNSGTSHPPTCHLPPRPQVLIRKTSSDRDGPCHEMPLQAHGEKPNFGMTALPRHRLPPPLFFQKPKATGKKPTR